MTTAQNYLPFERLLPLLRCVSCSGLILRVKDGALRCDDCKGTFPLEEGAFADFLSEENRKKLQRELEFWHAEFGEIKFEPEAEEHYQDLAKRLEVKSDMAVLEIGCGSGALLSRLPCAVRVGIDPAINLLRNSTRQFFGVLGMAERLPFQDASFDIVYFKDSLHHVEDKTAALNEAYRILKKDGRLVVIEPNASHPHRKILSNPKSIFRKSKLLIRVIGPVETFQTQDEILSWANTRKLSVVNRSFFQPTYNIQNLRQKLQTWYVRLGKFLLPEKMLWPEYFITLQKT